MKIFDFAIQMEVEGELFYRKLALQTPVPELKDILNFLADAEKEHIKIIKIIKDGNTALSLDEPRLDVGENFIAELRHLSLESLVPLGELQLYREALELEKKSADFYHSKGEEASSDGIQAVFWRLEKEELQHCFLLENILNFLEASI